MQTVTENQKTIETAWECWHYDVWGNARDGYEVNDRSCFSRSHEIAIPVVAFNVGTPEQFDSASPTDVQIREALDIKAGWPIETDGDDCYISVECGKTGKPLGEIRCISHASLSPIRVAEETVG